MNILLLYSLNARISHFKNNALHNCCLCYQSAIISVKRYLWLNIIFNFKDPLKTPIMLFYMNINFNLITEKKHLVASQMLLCSEEGMCLFLHILTSDLLKLRLWFGNIGYLKCSAASIATFSLYFITICTQCLVYITNFILYNAW